ncbi:hypothetical protein ABZ635_08895 [Nocardiopsis sp. NPDC007018]|uniref:hypothetical protein n=1 Tax=Nocardiopsis sp. NPDC007018 TaxID=3155721 RepID=UPI0033FB8227
MLDPGYLRALHDARFLAPGGYFLGSSIWREAGLRSVDLLISCYVDLLSEFSEPEVTEHPFLMRESLYRAVFATYGNVVTVDLSERGSQRHVLRPDNMPASVDTLIADGRPGPLVAVGGLLRRFNGQVAPLFRERYIWPAVQVTHMVERGRGEELLDRHQRALESLLTALALPVLSIRTDALSDYGHPCYLTVTCLPDGRPTVLSTSYLMSERYRSALGVEQDVLDIGFTGKVLAVVALHHRDHRGLALPSAVAPTQIGLIHEEHRRLEHHRMRDSLTASGLRTTLRTVHRDDRRRRSTAERGAHRLGAPLVVHDLGASEHTLLTQRLPIRRSTIRSAPGVKTFEEALHEHDERLLSHAVRRFKRSLGRGELLRPLCNTCVVERKPPVFGWVTPVEERACAHCGRSGRMAFISDQGRFY